MRRAELGCVVLALRNPPELLDAVRSLLEQDEPVDIVVVNSGGGGAAAALRAAGLDVEVIEHEEKLLPGGARNAGLVRLDTPFVAFLAADCIAEAGWAAARMRRHRAGAAAVASAITNADPRSVIAAASHAALFSSRMVGNPPSRAARYGASYARSLFDAHGLFRDDLRGGEDTDFHARFGGGETIEWEPAVRTAHRNPVTLRGLLHDQFRRGARIARAWRSLGGPGPIRVAWNAIQRVPKQAKSARAFVEPASREAMQKATLLLPLAAVAYALGALCSGMKRGR